MHPTSESLLARTRVVVYSFETVLGMAGDPEKSFHIAISLISREYEDRVVLKRETTLFVWDRGRENWEKGCLQVMWLEFGKCRTIWLESLLNGNVFWDTCDINFYNRRAISVLNSIWEGNLMIGEWFIDEKEGALNRRGRATLWVVQYRDPVWVKSVTEWALPHSGSVSHSFLSHALNITIYNILNLHSFPVILQENVCNCK